jgi:hypothetical protein
MVLQLRIKDFIITFNTKCVWKHAKGVEFLHKTAKRFSTWVIILIALTTMSLIPLPYLPNNVDIRHSASLGFNYDILDNLKISVRNLAQWPTVPAQLRVMKQSSGNNTMVNYGAK